MSQKFGAAEVGPLTLSVVENQVSNLRDRTDTRQYQSSTELWSGKWQQ